MSTSLMVLGRITRVCGLLSLAGLTGCAGHRYNHSPAPAIGDNRTEEPGYEQTTEQQIEDSRTAERVREALAAQADYRYYGVKVIATNGVVQLSGFVNTSTQRIRAEGVTRKVVGVKSVENKLIVRD
jgi:osmotically-inducible protein OsmY